MNSIVAALVVLSIWISIVQAHYSESELDTRRKCNNRRSCPSGQEFRRDPNNPRGCKICQCISQTNCPQLQCPPEQIIHLTSPCRCPYCTTAAQCNIPCSVRKPDCTQGQIPVPDTSDICGCATCNCPKLQCPNGQVPHRNSPRECPFCFKPFVCIVPCDQSKPACKDGETPQPDLDDSCGCKTCNCAKCAPLPCPMGQVTVSDLTTCKCSCGIAPPRFLNV